MDIGTFNLNLLRTLDALLEEGSVSGAARRLNLSQPAVSAALSRIRAALDDRILIRRGNRLVPSPYAEALRPEIRRILDDVHRVLSTFGAFDPGRDMRRFRIAATDYAAFVLLVPLARDIRGRAPEVAIDILPLDDRVETQLASGVCDLAVGGARWLRRLSRREILFSEDYVSLARSDHPRLSPTVTLDQFLAERHVLVSLQGGVTGVVDVALAEIGRERVVGITVPHFLLAPSAVAGTDLILTVGRRLAAAYAGLLDLRVFPTPVAVKPYRLPMGWHVRTEGDTAVEWLKSEMRVYARKLAST